MHILNVCVNNHFAKFEYKRMKSVDVTDYTNLTSPKHFGWNNVRVQHPIKWKKNERCKTYKLHIYNVWSINIQCFNTKEWKLLKLPITKTSHPKNVADGLMDRLMDGKMDGWSGSTTWPAFTKATHAKLSWTDPYIITNVISCSIK